MTKFCKKCEKDKELDLFYNMKTGKLGKDTYCIECRRQVNHDYGQQNRKARNAYANKYYHEVIKSKNNY